MSPWCFQVICHCIYPNHSKTQKNASVVNFLTSAGTVNVYRFSSATFGLSRCAMLTAGMHATVPMLIPPHLLAKQWGASSLLLFGNNPMEPSCKSCGNAPTATSESDQSRRTPRAVPPLLTKLPSTPRRLRTTQAHVCNLSPWGRLHMFHRVEFQEPTLLRLGLISGVPAKDKGTLTIYLAGTGVCGTVVSPCP